MKYPYSVERTVNTRGKRMILTCAGGKVRVVARPSVTDEEIAQFVSGHERFIENRMKRQYEAEREKNSFYVGDGMKVSLLGKEYTAFYGKDYGFDGERFTLREPEDGERILRGLAVVYSEIGEKYFADRVSYFMKVMGIKIHVSVYVSDASSFWGICRRRNGSVSVGLSWRLMMFSPDVIDSVVCHELSHIDHPDHGKDFYSRLSRFCPAHAGYRKYLGSESRILRARGWYF